MSGRGCEMQATDEIQPSVAGRQQLAARWLTFTRVVLPGMASAQRWPISLDHCFMRVCLDHAVAGRWDEVIRRPAIQHATEDQLRRAIEVAERIVAEPTLLPGLNQASLAMRGKVSRP